jgi:hypothetical protein
VAASPHYSNQPRSCLRVTKMCLGSPDGLLTPRRTDRLTFGGNIIYFHFVYLWVLGLTGSLDNVTPDGVIYHHRLTDEHVELTELQQV